MEENRNEKFEIEGRNAVMEAFRSGKTVDKLYLQDGCHDGSINSIVREAKKQETIINYVSKEKLNQMSSTGKHQGVIAHVAAYEYSAIDEIFAKAEEKGQPPFIFILDEIEDPHNLGAIVRTANLCGAHGVIIPKRRAVGITATVVKASAGAIAYTPVVKVTNLAKTIDELKKRGMWFACADMDGELMYRCNLTGPMGLVIGNEGTGVSRLVKEKCDYVVSICRNSGPTGAACQEAPEQETGPEKDRFQGTGRKWGSPEKSGPQTGTDKEQDRTKGRGPDRNRGQ